ncbi:MAG: peptidoglycan DD-metalloendopeptidase family protein [Candidatus Paceibacterota bacterium]|jgi:murein DD-endopeptidase MepM/ murein hydrolase activator NlpD
MKLKNQTNTPSLLIFFSTSVLISYFIINIIPAKAGIFENIINLFTRSSSAQENNTKDSLSDNDLLRPTINSYIAKDSSSSKSKNKDEEDSEDINISEDGLLVVQSGPMRLSTEKEKPISDTISLYEVKKGDTLDTVASLFGVSKNTIIWANNLKSKKLTVGDSLLIFPITGVQYTAKGSTSLAAIAKKYGADAEEIAEYNGISIDAKLAKGDVIFIPDAEMELEVDITKNKTTTTKKVVTPKYKNNVVAGYFMKPVSGCVRTQGLHGPYGTAIDFGCKVGTSIVAAADGVVIRAASSGYNGGYGEVVIISHPNGTQTIYAHLSQVSVSNGQKVSQGQVIGATGNTGRSTGPHLHFETRGTTNPF